MNQHRLRFLSTQQFRSHASALKVLALTERELEFYEKHCLLLPAALTHVPRAHAAALAERRFGVPVTNPEDLEPPEDWKRLGWRGRDGLHRFDEERGRNPLLVTPDCSTFEPWDANRVRVTTPDGRTIQHSTIERYYTPWQIHIVEALRRGKHFYNYTYFLRHIEPSHEVWRRHRLPEDTRSIRSLQGMEAGLDALARFRFAENDALLSALEAVSPGEALPEEPQGRLGGVLRRRALRSLDSSGLDEQSFFECLRKLVALASNYRADQRISLAEDAEEYIAEAQVLAHYAFEHSLDAFLEVARVHAGLAFVTDLRRLDPVSTAADGARRNLTAIFSEEPATGVLSAGARPASTADEIVKFCLDHDLLEVLSSLERYSYTADEQRRDPFPGFFSRRLRPLALAGEQLARGVLETAASTNAGGMGHRGEGYSALIKVLGTGSSWLPAFQKLVGDGQTSDKAGDLEERALHLTAAALDASSGSDEAIANTLGAAVATRNLVSHQHRLLPSHVVETLASPCADAVALVWLLAKAKGFV